MDNDRAYLSNDKDMIKFQYEEKISSNDHGMHTGSYRTDWMRWFLRRRKQQRSRHQD